MTTHDHLAAAERPATARPEIGTSAQVAPRAAEPSTAQTESTGAAGVPSAVTAR